MKNVTIKIILITCIFFFIEFIIPESIYIFALRPSIAFSGFFWQFITYIVIHANFAHIFINMFVLFMFGPVVERKIGDKNFLALYLFSGIISALLHILLTFGEDILMLGASGSTFGVMAAYAYLYPKNWIIVFPGIPVPAYILVIFLIFFELFSGIFGTEPGIANFGHVGGIIGGLLFMYYWKKKQRKLPFGYEFIWE